MRSKIDALSEVHFLAPRLGLVPPSHRYGAQTPAAGAIPADTRQLGVGPDRSDPAVEIAGAGRFKFLRFLRFSDSRAGIRCRDRLGGLLRYYYQAA
jgi:hypothetical protein